MSLVLLVAPTQPESDNIESVSTSSDTTTDRTSGIESSSSSYSNSDSGSGVPDRTCYSDTATSSFLDNSDND